MQWQWWQIAILVYLTLFIGYAIYVRNRKPMICAGCGRDIDDYAPCGSRICADCCERCETLKVKGCRWKEEV
jgi:hypothetical protein